MHIFLTGERNIGKTTIINKIIERFSDDKKVMGFRTYMGEDFAPGKNYVCIADVNSDTDLINDSNNRIALRDKTARRFQAYPETFDSVGVQFLTNSNNTDLIIMDELGFMESEAYKFQSCVLDILDKDTTILGVIKPNEHPFLDKIRAHPKTYIIEVTEQNRDQLADKIVEENLWHLLGQKTE